jgi:hypothetical protein
MGACVLRLLVVFVPRTSSTPVATCFWQTEGRNAERVILGVRPSEFILSEFQSPSRKTFISSHSLPPLSGCLIGPSLAQPKFLVPLFPVLPPLDPSLLLARCSLLLPPLRRARALGLGEWAGRTARHSRPPFAGKSGASESRRRVAE